MERKLFMCSNRGLWSLGEKKHANMIWFELSFNHVQYCMLSCRVGYLLYIR